MYAIEISMDPKIVQLGSLSIDWHGIMVVLALVCGVALTFYLAKKTGLLAQYAKPDANADGEGEDTDQSSRKEGGKPKTNWSSVLDQLLPLILAAVIAGILGSRIFHVVDQWEKLYAGNLRAILNLWEGSSIVGAVVVGAIGATIYAKLAHWSWTRLGRIADVAAPGSILAMAIGRIGCLINGDAYGTPTGLPWGVTYTHPNHVTSTRMAPYVGHPAPAYEIIWDLLIFAFLMIFRKRLRPASVSYWCYLALYSLGRFLITFVRVNDPYLWGLKQAQVVTLFLMIFCVPLIFYLVKNRDKFKDYV